MSIETAIHCDACNADLSVTDEPAAYRLTLTADSIRSSADPNEPTPAVLVENPVPNPLHFCNTSCLVAFIQAATKGT